MQQQDFFFGFHPGEVVLVVASGIERAVESLCRIPKRIAVRRIGRGHGSHGFRQVIEDFRRIFVLTSIP